MLPFLLGLDFILLLVFGGYTSGWEQFDYWWGGGAVVCGALLLSGRPLRIHVLSLFLLPALAALALPWVWTSMVVQNLCWWFLGLFLMIFLPTRNENCEAIGEILFYLVLCCGVVLTILYLIQDTLALPVRGFGYARSAEAQVLLGALACLLFKPNGSRLWQIVGFVVVGYGVYSNGSRSAWLGAGMLLAGYLWMRRKAYWTCALIAMAAVTIVVGLSLQRMAADPHAEVRGHVYMLAAQIFSEHPAGSGAGTFLTESLSRSFPVDDHRYLSRYAKIIPHAHNVILQWAAEGGVTGMATVIGILASCGLMLANRMRRRAGGWPIVAAVAWCPAFVFELMLNVTESLSFIRWMGLVGVLALTTEYSVPLPRVSPKAVRLCLLVLGGAMIFVGWNDLMARQSVRIGINEEGRGNRAEALKSYEDARTRRPWDEQALLHIAHAAVAMGRRDLAEASIDQALRLDQGQGAARYHGAGFCREMFVQGRGETGARLFHKSRHLMFTLNDLQPCDVPMYLEGIAWSRGDSEIRWRLRRVLSLEPRAVRAYESMARIAASAGDAGRAERFRTLAERLRQLYEPGILRGLAASSARSVYRYERHLL